MLSFERQPGVVRALLLLGGLGMVVAPFLKWDISWGLGGEPIVHSGFESPFGIIVVIAGAGTLTCGLVPKLAPLGILSGLVAGASAGLALLDVLPWLAIPDATMRPGGGLLLALGSAALAGAGGVTGLAVAASAQVREQG